MKFAQQSADWTRDARLAAQRERTAQLTAPYERLAFDQNDGDKGNFLSGWQCENPLSRLIDAAVAARYGTLDKSRYSYFDDQLALSESILQLHEAFDGVSPEAVLCGAGTTSLLFTFATYLSSLGTKTVYYVPPLFNTLYPALDRYGIETLAVSTKQPYEKDFCLELPQGSGHILLLTDPTWYAGIPFGEAAIKVLAHWQRATSSIIFVDGSLQYLKWDGSTIEATSQLEPELTFRLLCPAKQLMAHGYRFSYLLIPHEHQRGMAWTYTNVFGPAAVESIAFGFEAIRASRDRAIPRQLMTIAQRRHQYLRHHGLVESILTPSCGYFVFEKLNVALPEGHVVVNGSFFGQNAFPSYIKINLLSPSMKFVHMFERTEQ